MSTSITAATTKLFEVLQPLGSEERLRVVQAVLTLLGEHNTSFSSPPPPPPPGGGTASHHEEKHDDGVNLSGPARAWARKYGISTETLCQYFDISGGKATLIGLPGNGKGGKEQTLTTYLMMGLANYLTTGEPTFSDDDARQMCVHFGCFERKNHTRNLGSLGNRVTGSKDAGWKLTAPGLTSVAGLLKG